MIHVGKWNDLKIVKAVDFGLYLDGGEAGEILLPKRFMPQDANPGDVLRVFIYHDSDNRLLATTQTPLGVVGEIVMLVVVDANQQGAFLDWGLMKDLFVPLSQQRTQMNIGGHYLVGIYLDERTGRVAATQKIERLLSNETIALSERDEVALTIWRTTDIGYFVIINNQHTGVLHYSDVIGELEAGQKRKGFIKSILPENKIDVALGAPGYARVTDATEKVLSLLLQYDGYLPYNDSSDPEQIREFFGMSKKTFKMSVGALLKSGKIQLTQTGVRKKE